MKDKGWVLMRVTAGCICNWVPCLNISAAETPCQDTGHELKTNFEDHVKIMERIGGA